MQRFLSSRHDTAPRLAELASLFADHADLERRIDRCIDPGGEVRDDASAELAAARRESNQLASDLQKRLARYLRDPNVAPSLSDDFYTVRNERYVLPVRADARRSVRGIVHDASRSGTTLFVEPDEVVERNNHLKRAQLTVAREVERVLRELSERVATEVPALRADLATLARIDLAFARGQLSHDMQAVEPRVERDGVFHLDQLRHPLLPVSEAVPNDLRLGEGWHVLVISGPNAGGKTVALKSLGLAALLVRAGLHVPAAPGARVALVDRVLADIGDGQDMRQSLSTFSAHMLGLAEIVQAASRDSLALLDEVGVGTDPGEGAALAQSILETLADAGVRVVATTHYNLLKEMAAVDERFCNASVEFDPETLAPSYRVRLGAAGASSATSVAARMGMPTSVLERANALLDREDRRLDRMLSELGASRAALEAEQREVSRLRADSEGLREEYRRKLERLHERRDKLFLSMREDLDRAFKQAHREVAGVIRDLQRGSSARDAASARTRLQELEAEARESEQAAGVRRADDERAPSLDWRHARAGDTVGLPGGTRGLLVSLPDRQGRVRVRSGSATLVLASDRVTAPDPASRPPGANEPSRTQRKSPRTQRSRTPDDGLLAGGTLHCDLRGLRVEEAIERIASALDRALSDDRAAVEFVHGVGSGALRRVVREALAASPYVSAVRTGDPDRGGEGVTLADMGR
jgi:DNA mismatch repair protein MutS2